MDEKLSKRIKYLVLFLLDLRSNTERVNGYTESAIFNIDEIKSPEFNQNNNEDKLSEIINSLEEIRKYELQNPGEYPYTAIKEIASAENDKKIEVVGTTNDLLRYIHKMIKEGNSVFGFSTNNRHQQILTLLNKKTSVKISGKPHLFLSYLLKRPNKDVSYKNLFNEIERSGRYGEDYLALYKSDESRKLRFVNDGVTQLKNKLDKALSEKFKGIKLEIIKNKRYKGEGDEPGIYELLI